MILDGCPILPQQLYYGTAVAFSKMMRWIRTIFATTAMPGAHHPTTEHESWEIYALKPRHSAHVPSALFDSLRMCVVTTKAVAALHSNQNIRRLD